MIRYLNKFTNIRKIYNVRYFSLNQQNPEDFVKQQSLDKQNGDGDHQPLDPNNMENNENYYTDKRSNFYIFIAAALTLSSLYFVYQMNLMRDNVEKTKNSVVKTSGTPLIGGSWELNGPKGVVSSDSLRGKYYLIYFGFCNCPDICPQSMRKIAKALDILDKMTEKKYFDIEYIFVSVDPDRDSYDKITKFCNHFSKKIIPVTGKSNKDPNLRDVMKKFKIYASKIEMEDPETKQKSYTLDHTIITYLMGKDNQYLSHIGGSMNANDIAHHIVDKVMEAEKNMIKSY